MDTPGTQPVPKLAEARTVTLRDHLVNIFRLVIKELRSIRSDPTMLILVVYAFQHLRQHSGHRAGPRRPTSVGIADEDGSNQADRRRPCGWTFQPAVQIRRPRSQK